MIQEKHQKRKTKLKQFECQYCKTKFPIEKESIETIIAHLETHKPMAKILKQLTRASLEVAIQKKDKL